MISYILRQTAKEGGGIVGEKCKLLIADTSETIRGTLRDILAERYDIWVCGDGRTALEMLYRFRPDMLVMDLMLPGMDGLSLLQTAAEAGICPTVLATTRYENEYILDAAYRLGVRYIMARPCEIGALVDRIQDLADRYKEDLAAMDGSTMIKRILVRLGFSVKAKSYPVLEKAVLLIAENPDMFLSKELYPAVGKPFGISGTAVEKRIRDLLHSAWEKGDRKIWQLYFPPDAAGEVQCPSNGAFIARIAECLPTPIEHSGWSNV